MSRGGRKKKAGGGDSANHPDERWMASYMDMVTVLMCTFIVLFSMSKVDAGKYEELKNSLQTGFGVQDLKKVDIAKGIVVPPTAKPTTTPNPPTALQLAQAEVNNLEALKQQINAQLTAKGLQNSVSYSIDSRGLTIGLVGNQTFFDSNLATLAPVAVSIIDTVGPVLAGTTYNISIEGHADIRQPGPPYATNWDLAGARAISVLRRMVESDGMPDKRIVAASYGSADASAPNTDPAGQAQDRRVDIVVLSAQSEDVRKLIPQILAAQGGK